MQGETQLRHHTDHEESHAFPDHGEDRDADPNDSRRKMEIKKKLEERMEKRRLKLELEDYEGELDNNFDWDDFDKK